MVGVGGEFDAGGQAEGTRVVVEAGRQPADGGPRGGFEFGFRAVFGLEPVLDDFELEGADGGEQGRGGRVVGEVELLDDAFLEELVEAFAELFVFGGAGIAEVGEAFGREAGDFAVFDGGVGGEGVADAEFVVADDADDVAGEGFVDGLAFVGEEFVGAGEADFFPGARVVGDHVAFESAGDDAEEGDAVAMAGVHVGLDFEDEAGEGRVVGGDRLAVDVAGSRRGGVLEEPVEQQLDAEVVHGAAEEDRGGVAGQHGGGVEGFAGKVKHLQFFADAPVGRVVNPVADDRVGDVADLDRGAIHPARGALEEMDLAGEPVVDALEGGAVADGPVDGEGAELEDVFQFVNQGEWFAGRPVAFVHEGKDGHAALVADFEEFTGLAFDAFGGVNDHDHRVHGGEDPVGVFGEVFVAGGVEEIDPVAVVIELQGGGADGDAALAFQFHPVGGGGALMFAGGDGAGQLHGAAVEQELLGHRCLPGIGMGDDGEGAAFGDFGGDRHGRRLYQDLRWGQKFCFARRAG